MPYLEKISPSFIPLSLYIHIPWCIRKCPYCDFNSHTLKTDLNESRYIDSLIADFQSSLNYIQNRPIHSIFFGGGTPSLFKPESYERLLSAIFKEVSVVDNLEITLEANPGTVDEHYFKGYRTIGINRLSLGVQSFDTEKLKKLGRIHTAEQATNAFHVAQQAGFNNINIDLMFGLPDQSLEEALLDLSQAVALNPTHLSWYQLTLEPNTVFYKYPPVLPNEDKLWEIETQGKQFIEKHYQQYEISAYSKKNQQCQHNLNYWLFGDYLGIGAGAHGKITTNNNILRTQKKRQPEDYMNGEKNFVAKEEVISPKEISFEFILNASRLHQAIPYSLLEERAGLSYSAIEAHLLKAESKGLVEIRECDFEITSLGHRYLNNVQELFL